MAFVYKSDEDYELLLRKHKKNLPVVLDGIVFRLRKVNGQTFFESCDIEPIDDLVEGPELTDIMTDQFRERYS